MTKKEIKSRVANAYNVKSETIGTRVVFQVYADSHYILDTEEDNVIECLETEEEAIEYCNGVNSGEFSDDGSKSNCYYKPILIDADSGERITRQTIDNYKKHPTK